MLFLIKLFFRLIFLFFFTHVIAFEFELVIMCNTGICHVFLSSKINQTNSFRELFPSDIYAKSSRFMHHRLHFLRVMLLLVMLYFPVWWCLIKKTSAISSWILYNLILKTNYFPIQNPIRWPLVFNGSR